MILLKAHKQALLHYINTYPNCWKSRIIQDWDHFSFCTPTLRVLRSTYGASWLYKLTADKVRSAEIRLDSKGQIAR